MIKERLDYLIGNKLLVGYVSDLEGNLDAWFRYLNNSRVLQLEVTEQNMTNDGNVVVNVQDEFAAVIHSPGKKTGSTISNENNGSPTKEKPTNETKGKTFLSSNYKITLRERCLFVFGGDVCDRGSGDLQIIRDLLSLKDRYPDRVYFILGNRDVNKLRLPVALHRNMLKLPAKTFWVNPSESSSNVQENDKITTGEPTTADRIERLKWILRATMGAPFAFECRREELARNNLPSTDSDVLDSFLNSVLPGEQGILLKYLTRAQLSFIVSDALFVHGAVNDYYLGWVPPSINHHLHHLPNTSDDELTSITKRLDLGQRETSNNNNNINKAEVYADLRVWSNHMNDFAAAELQHYQNNILNYLQMLDHLSSPEELTESAWDLIGGYSHPQPASRLIQCGMGMLPDHSTNPSIIYSSYLNKGKPVLPGNKACEALRASNISKVIVGHQPNGDLPLVLEHQQIQVICADNSYSKFVKYPKSQLVRSTLCRDLRNPSNESNHSNTTSNTTATTGHSQQPHIHSSPPRRNSKSVNHSSSNHSKHSQSNSKHVNTLSVTDEQLLENIHDDWLDTTTFINAFQRVQHENTSTEPTNEDATTAPPPRKRTAAEEAETRDAVSVSEVCVSITSVEFSEVVVHGRLSNAAVYAFKLPSTAPTTNNHVTSPHHPNSQCFVGRVTADGEWFVKASGVVFPHEVSQQSVGNLSSRRDEEMFYVLSASEGFSFKNRIVSHRELLREFRHTSATPPTAGNTNSQEQHHQQQQIQHQQQQQQQNQQQQENLGVRPRSASKSKALAVNGHENPPIISQSAHIPPHKR